MRVVGIGGGHGLAATLRAARLYARRFTPQAVAARYAAAYRDLCTTSGTASAAVAA